MPDLKGLDNIYLVLAFIVPGLVAMFCRAQFVTGRVPSKADAILPSLSLSFVYYAFVLPIVEHMSSLKGPFLLVAFAWLGLIFVGPALFGAILGIITQKDWGRTFLQWLLRCMSINVVHSIPTAWDWKLSTARDEWVHVVLKDGTEFAGYYGAGSFASSHSQGRDIYIQEVFDIDIDNIWTSRKSALLILAGEIRTIEFFPVEAKEPGDEQGQANDTAG